MISDRFKNLNPLLNKITGDLKEKKKKKERGGGIEGDSEKFKYSNIKTP